MSANRGTPGDAVLVADIGGTNARFALADASAAAPLRDDTVREFKVTEFPSLAEAAKHYLEEQGATAQSGVFAVAGRVDGDEARITNHPWVISRSRTQQMLGFDSLHLVNDFAAQAMAISVLRPEDVTPIGGARWTPAAATESRTYAVIGPGTGLGVGGLVVRDGHFYPLETEGGHVSFPPGTPEEIQVLEKLSEQFGRVSNERLICGPGLVNVHRALSQIAGEDPGPMQPSDITERAAAGDARSMRAVDVYCAVFGAIAGDLVLTLGGLGRRVPHRRPGAQDAGLDPPLRLPPALRAQGPLLRRDVARAVAGRHPSTAGPAWRGGVCGRLREPVGGARMTPAIDPLQGIDPDALDRVVLLRHASASAWTEAVAAELDAILRHDLDVNGRARLLLSGGSTPSPVHRALAQRKLDWANVEVGLVDERWLSPKDPDSNAYLVRDTLLFDGGPPQLASTPFSPLVRPGQSRSDSVHAANTHARHAVRASAAVLGMGPDGHTASLFPGSRDLGRVLASQEPYQALDATGCPVAGDYTQRITLTPGRTRAGQHAAAAAARRGQAGGAAPRARRRRRRRVSGSRGDNPAGRTLARALGGVIPAPDGPARPGGSPPRHALPAPPHSLSNHRDPRATRPASRPIARKPMSLHPRIEAVTQRIIERSAPSRAAYLAGIDAAHASGPLRTRLSCGNLAHAFAASEPTDKARLSADKLPNLGVITAYNDMLSAHQPYEDYPKLIRDAARAAGGTAQVAGGVPAMCDGVTQGRPGMDLSLFSRDVIAQATAIGLTHDMFDASLYLGICDKIVPGLLIGALAFGHLPAIFVPGGPMTPGIPNKLKAEVRERYAAGEATREELLEAEAGSYHAPGTCTFYGTANSNQVLLEAMGVQLPGSSFINPDTPLRGALTRAAVRRALEITALGNDYRPLGRLIDERAIINAVIALMATGGSTNHTIHWVAVARAAGIVLTWDDIDALAQAVPLLARVYPNGEADVNRFAAAGGTQYVFRELLEAGLMHDLTTIVPGGMHAFTREPRLVDGELDYADGSRDSGDLAVVRPVSEPFEAHGGLRLMRGNLGRSLMKISAIKPEYRFIEAPAVVVDAPQALNKLHAAGVLPHDFVAVVRYNGPRANGMPEMHSLTPLLGMLQNQGRRVALVTDGRLSGASGKIPAAIHVTPEAARGGPIGKVREGDMIRLDGENGTLEVLVPADEWAAREHAPNTTPPAHDLGRNLFAINRQVVGHADQGALSISCGPPTKDGRAWEYDSEYELGGDRGEAALAPHTERDA